MAVSRITRDTAQYRALVREDDYFRSLAELSLTNKGIKKPTDLQLKIEMLFLAHKHPRYSIFLTNISGQEINSLLLASWGLEVEEIAEILLLQPDSVLKTRGKILQKLNARNITHAAIKANQAGILTFDNVDFLLRPKSKKTPTIQANIKTEEFENAPA